MNFEDLKNRIFILISTVIVSILLLLLDSVGVVSKLYDITSIASVPLRLELRKFSLNMNDVLGVISQVTSLRDSNELLREENQKLLEQLSKQEEIKVESDALKEQLELGEISREWILQARVIGTNLTSENSIQINAGTNDGVSEGDVVVFGQYAIGVVKRVESYYSKVILITSSSSNIPVRGQKNRAIGLVNGDVGLTLEMTDILPDEVIEEGEIVVTSGVDSEFPANYIIGSVSSVNNNPANTTQIANINLQIDFSKLDYIYVVKGQVQ
ncbi:rod shape-determining protein MreC [Patescibacteria group bacterium]